MGDISRFYDYNFINQYNSAFAPSTVHVSNSTTSLFFQRYLAQKLIANFKFDGIPEDWAENYFTYNLFLRGFLAIINTDQYGVIPQHCSLFGQSIFYQPTHVIVTNQLLEPIQAQIGTEAALVKMQPDYCGAYDLITFYADNMALCAEAAGINMINSKLAYVFAAENKNAATSLKKLYDEIAEGNPAVFADKNLFYEDGSPSWGTFQQNLKQTFIAPEVLDTLINWEVRFNTEIGIPNVNLAKASGVSAEEVDANTMETQIKAKLWADTINKSLKTANELFNLDMSVELVSEKKDAEIDEKGDYNSNVDIIREHLRRQSNA